MSETGLDTTVTHYEKKMCTIHKSRKLVLFFGPQNQELGVRGQPDRRPDGPLCSARRAWHHVHHTQGNASADVRRF